MEFYGRKHFFFRFLTFSRIWRHSDLTLKLLVLNFVDMDRGDKDIYIGINCITSSFCRENIEGCNNLLGKAKKNQSYVSKLPRAFVFRCAFDSAKLKVWFFFFFLLAYFLSSLFMNVLVKIYKKRYDRHNETLWTTDFFNSVFCLVSCSSKIKFHISKLWPTQIWHVCCSGKKKKKKKRKKPVKKRI